MKTFTLVILSAIICVLLVVLINDKYYNKVEPEVIIEKIKEIEIVEIKSEFIYKTSTELNEEVVKIIEGGGTQQLVDFFYLYTGDNIVTISIIEESIKQSVPITAAFALAWGESRFKPNLINKNGGHSSDWGLFQLNDSYRNWTKEEFFDIKRNAKEGLRYFSKCLVEFDYNLVLSIAAYNKGFESIKLRQNVAFTTLMHINNIIEFEHMLELQLNRFINRWNNG